MFNLNIIWCIPPLSEFQIGLCRGMRYSEKWSCLFSLENLKIAWLFHCPACPVSHHHGPHWSPRLPLTGRPLSGGNALLCSGPWQAHVGTGLSAPLHRAIDWQPSQRVVGFLICQSKCCRRWRCDVRDRATFYKLLFPSSSILPGSRQPGNVSLLAEGEGGHRSRCSRRLQFLSWLAVMCCATSVYAEVCHIASHLPHGALTHGNRGTDMQCAQKLPILTMAINSVIHDCETACFSERSEEQSRARTFGSWRTDSLLLVATWNTVNCTLITLRQRGDEDVLLQESES